MSHPGNQDSFAARCQRRLTRWMPQSLLGRLSLVMLAGVMLVQFAGNAIWAAQMRSEARTEVRTAAEHLGHSAASSLRYFLSLPVNYRGLVIQQFREMGGTRFFANLTDGPVSMAPFADEELSTLALQQVRKVIQQELPAIRQLQVSFAWPQDLRFSQDGTGISDVPDKWVEHILVTRPKPAPIMVIQAELDSGNWLYLATLMPNPYFLNGSDPFSGDRVLLQVLTLLAVFVLSLLVVRWITRPLAALSSAADAFGQGDSVPALPDTGSKEFLNTARAFALMRERIQRYIEDRERLFVSISHDLRTPIMRLKLRAELLDDDATRSEFHDDLDELDMMVKGALQCVKDSDIHENPTAIRLDALIGRMVRDVKLGGHAIAFEASGISVVAKPLALKRAISNLLNNALHYGKDVGIAVHRTETYVDIAIRDHGPGVPEQALATLFDPYVRLEHGRQSNQSGMGLGLGIARDIVQAHQGELILQNAAGGGLLACIRLPVQVLPDSAQD
ncbi:ATP-binding protein [Undibacterium curvum]|nr:ATP-binding protein [Undibacterium curvum]